MKNPEGVAAGLNEGKSKDQIISEYRSEIAKLRVELQQRIDVEKGNYWYWQGDGRDDPESLTCLVVMHPDDLRALLKRIPEDVSLETQGVAAGLNESKASQQSFRKLGYTINAWPAWSDGWSAAIAYKRGAVLDNPVVAVREEENGSLVFWEDAEHTVEKIEEKPTLSMGILKGCDAETRTAQGGKSAPFLGGVQLAEWTYHQDYVNGYARGFNSGMSEMRKALGEFKTMPKDVNARMRVLDGDLRNLVELSRKWEKAYGDLSRDYDSLGSEKGDVEEVIAYIVREYGCR